MFGGVICYLNSKVSNGSALRSGLISVTASSVERNDSFNAVDFSSNRRWASKNSPNQWFQIDLKAMKIRLNGYSIQTPFDVGNDHLRNWVVEGSNSKASWTTLDAKKDNSDLRGSNRAHYFPISKESPPFQIIRLKMTGPNHGGNWYFNIDKIEIFGELINSSS